MIVIVTQSLDLVDKVRWASTNCSPKEGSQQSLYNLKVSFYEYKQPKLPVLSCMADLDVRMRNR